MKTTTLHEPSVHTHQRRLYREFAPDINVVTKKTIKQQFQKLASLFYSILPADCQPKTVSDKWYIATVLVLSFSLILPVFLPIAVYTLYKAKKGGKK